MDRLFIPLIPAMIIGAVADGTGFTLSDAVFIGLAAWAVFVVFRSLLGVTSTIVAVCMLGALAQISPQGPPPAYASTAAEASPGTITHLVRAVYRAVGGEVSLAPVSTAGASTGPSSTGASSTGMAPAAGVAAPPVTAVTPVSPMIAAMAPLPGAASPRPRAPVAIASVAPLPVGTMLRTPTMPAFPITVAGQPRVVDGATLFIDGHLVRLAGISAPDGASDCWRNGQPANCSAMATERLSQLVGAARVTCHGPAQGSAIAALCSTPMVDDLAKALLDEGWALLNRESAPSYRAVAATARGARRGFWQSNFARADELEPPVTTARR